MRFSEGSKQTLGTQSTTASERAMGDLELACLLVEVFQNERDACCVVLPDAKAVTAANRAWKGMGYTPRIETRSALGKSSAIATISPRVSSTSTVHSSGWSPSRRGRRTT